MEGEEAVQILPLNLPTLVLSFKPGVMAGRGKI